ncbi:hypothetical protein F511_45513 [Dorcoceras hygrometricum]|uniref:Uncharacterized protein n=1 Tax=Dorcoceras hygrometricum TaxID=472368 RepID=A0A2Z6ZVT7_9LAMI|nr:hypothetical protein F511_45513 [Dorcoceras hygrometricum]
MAAGRRRVRRPLPRAHVRARHAHWMRMAAENWPPPSRMEAEQLLMDAQPTGRRWPLSRSKIAQPMAAGRATLRAAVRRAWRGDVRLLPPDLLAAAAAVGRRLRHHCDG